MAAERHASSTAVSPEDNNLFLDILHEAPLFGHRKPTRFIGSIIYCFILVVYAALAVGAPWILRSIQKYIAPSLCSCGVVLLILTGLLQQYLVYQVQKIRLQGYYSFSQKLKHIVRLPFFIIAYGTAAMLLVMVWKPHVSSILSLSMILRIIMVVEAICAGSFVSVYIGYVHQYNSLHSQPDVLKSLYSPLQQSSSLEANLSTKDYSVVLSEHPSGVYFGWAGLSKQGVFKMVMSVGWNPYFNNTEKAIEPWLLHEFDKDFYGEELHLVIVGYIRSEENFPSLESLIAKINDDRRIAERALDLPLYLKYKDDEYLKIVGSGDDPVPQ